MVSYGDGYIVWWTFAGKLVNAAVANALAGKAQKVVSDNLSVSFSGTTDLKHLKNTLENMMLYHSDNLIVPLDESFIDELKFSECLPQTAKKVELAERYDISRQVKQFFSYPLIAIHIHG